MSAKAASQLTRYSSLKDLAKLPYFDLDETGELTIADPKYGRAIDVHTHLALSYLLPATVDLMRETPAVEHYLPATNPVDLELYANLNFTPFDLKRMERDLTIGSLGKTGMRATHTLPNLARELARLGLQSAVLLPIDAPILSNNAERWLRAASGRPDFIGFGSVHPFNPFPARALDRQRRLGARGIKLHPAVQMVGPDHPRTIHVCRLAGERNLVVLFHCGPVNIETALGRRLSQVRRYEKVIAECPDTTFILGHAGALQYEEGIELARRYPNALVEIASQSLPGVRRVLEALPRDRVLFGSDWPFYPIALPLAKVLIATEGDEALREAILFRNAERLFHG